MARKILVVEDDRNISDLIRMYLEKEGFEVQTAFDGGTAVETFRTPKDTFTDPQAAYAEVEKALASISEKIAPGLDKAAKAEQTLDRNMEMVKSLYLD